MIEDKREEILSYLQTLLGSISGLASTWRNRDALGDDEITSLPAAILFDADEEKDPSLHQQEIERKFRVQPQTIMIMRPQIVVQLYPRITPQQQYITDASQPAGQRLDPTGPELSSWRMKVMNAILGDPGLVGDGSRQNYGLLGPTGGVFYSGCETDYKIGSPMAGLLMLGFEFRYVLAF